MKRTIALMLLFIPFSMSGCALWQPKPEPSAVPVQEIKTLLQPSEIPPYQRGLPYLDLGELTAELYEEARACNADKKKAIHLLEGDE